MRVTVTGNSLYRLAKALELPPLELKRFPSGRRPRRPGKGRACRSPGRWEPVLGGAEDGQATSHWSRRSPGRLSRPPRFRREARRGQGKPGRHRRKRRRPHGVGPEVELACRRAGRNSRASRRHSRRDHTAGPLEAPRRPATWPMGHDRAEDHPGRQMTSPAGDRDHGRCEEPVRAGSGTATCCTATMRSTVARKAWPQPIRPDSGGGR